jgi:hypothetical protein
MTLYVNIREFERKQKKTRKILLTFYILQIKLIISKIGPIKTHTH